MGSKDSHLGRSEVMIHEVAEHLNCHYQPSTGWLNRAISRRFV